MAGQILYVFTHVHLYHRKGELSLFTCTLVYYFILSTNHLDNSWSYYFIPPYWHCSN